MTDPHELLPWYVNGTLEAREREEFERHLQTCLSCRQELPVLQDVSRQVRAPGWAAHAEHPDPETLSRVVADGEEDAAVRRHLALCLTCAEEARWLTGEAVAGGSAARRRTGAWIVPAAAIAAGLLVVVTAGLLMPWRGPATPAGVFRPVMVPAIERAAGATVVQVPRGAGSVQVLLQADLAPDDFPVRFEVSDASGRAVFAAAGLKEDDLFRGILGFTCPRADCPDGDYVARLTPARAGRPPIAYPFSIFTDR
ncbi:MAG: zf-HC2 domain-containing protein [Candidatus Polarisedimenticolia bacterium]